MALPTNIGDLSTTASSNYPDSTEALTTGDDTLRQWAAFIATLHADKAPKASPTFTGTVTLPLGEAGTRSIVRVASTGKTIDATDNGKCISTSGNITVPDAVMSAGNAVSIYNSSASSISIVQGSGVTLQQAAGTTGTKTLAAKGLVTIWWDTASVAVISGAGLS